MNSTYALLIVMLVFAYVCLLAMWLGWREANKGWKRSLEAWGEEISNHTTTLDALEVLNGACLYYARGGEGTEAAQEGLDKALALMTARRPTL